jgi:hypothetical protein
MLKWLNLYPNYVNDPTKPLAERLGEWTMMALVYAFVVGISVGLIVSFLRMLARLVG